MMSQNISTLLGSVKISPVKWETFLQLGNTLLKNGSNQPVPYKTFVNLGRIPKDVDNYF